MSEQGLKIRIDGRGLPEDFIELVERCHQENPDKDDVKELRRQLDKHPEWYRGVVDMAKGIQDMLVRKLASQDTLELGVRAHIQVMKGEMFYDHVPVIERLLIDNVINCWLRYQWVEYWLASLMGQSATFEQVQHWERRLSAIQRRYLRACETLARVRKITRSTIQANIAKDGGQQINVAGIC